MNHSQVTPLFCHTNRRLRLIMHRNFNFMEQSPFQTLVVAWQLASSRLLWNPKDNYSVHKNPPLVLTLREINPIHTLMTYFFKIHSNITVIALGGIMVTCLLLDPRFAGSNPAEGDKNRHQDFHRRGSKAAGLMS